jgi:hypothetical protein
LFAVPARFFHASHFASTVKISDPFVQQRMRVWFADHENVKILVDSGLAERLMAIKIISQQSDTPRRVVAAPGIQPTFGCGDFTILFFVTILA